MPFWSQMDSHREPKIAQNLQKSCSRGLPQSILKKVTNNAVFWVPSRPQNIGFRAIGVSKIKKSPVPQNASHFGCFWHHIWQKAPSRRVPENVSKNEPKKCSKITSKRVSVWPGKSPKSLKSEPWAQNVPQASRRGPQAPKIFKNHEKWAPKSLKNMRIW